jgi:predicted MFS family arabinose efflux permease
MASRPASLWRDMNFVKLWIGQTISEVGSRMTVVVLPLVAVLVLHAKPFQMGVLAGIGGLASLIFGLAAGLCVDRLQRKPILIVTDLGRAAVLGSIPVAAVLGVLTLKQIYVVVAVAGILTVFFDVAYQSYLPSLVARDQVIDGNSKLALSSSIAEIAGPGLTGILVQVFTAPMAILLDALSFLASALTVWLVRKPEPQVVPVQGSHVWGELIAGMRAITKSPLRQALAGHTATAGFFGGFFASLYVLYVVKDLHLSPALLGTVIAIGGAGNILGAGIAPGFMRHFGIGMTLIGSLLVMGLSSLMIPLAHGSVVTATAFLIVAQVGDVCWPVFNVGDLSLRQAITPGDVLGRVNAAMQMLNRGLLPIGSLGAGALAEGIGLRATLAVGAAGLLLSSLWLVLSPIRRLRYFPDQENSSIVDQTLGSSKT